MSKQQPTFSNSKIIFSVFFVCAALMTSMLVFHARQKAMPLVITAEQGLLFPVAREIKSFELKSTRTEAFTRKDLLNHWTLLFFGFTHCASICPTTLDMLNRAYAELHPLYPHLQIWVVSLDPERDTTAAVTDYVHGFNPDFIGLTGEVPEIRKLQAQFGIYSERDNDGQNYQLQHTPTIVLINPQGKWAGVFKYNLPPDVLRRAFTASVKSVA